MVICPMLLNFLYCMASSNDFVCVKRFLATFFLYKASLILSLQYGRIFFLPQYGFVIGIEALTASIKSDEKAFILSLAEENSTKEQRSKIYVGMT